MMRRLIMSVYAIDTRKIYAKSSPEGTRNVTTYIRLRPRNAQWPVCIRLFFYAFKPEVHCVDYVLCLGWCLFVELLDMMTCWWQKNTWKQLIY